jgi:predicted RNA-binding protein with EMAP domain
MGLDTENPIFCRLQLATKSHVSAAIDRRGIATKGELFKQAIGLLKSVLQNIYQQKYGFKFEDDKSLFPDVKSLAEKSSEEIFALIRSKFDDMFEVRKWNGEIQYVPLKPNYF